MELESKVNSYAIAVHNYLIETNAYSHIERTVRDVAALTLLLLPLAACVPKNEVHTSFRTPEFDKQSPTQQINYLQYPLFTEPKKYLNLIPIISKEK